MKRMEKKKVLRLPLPGYTQAALSSIDMHCSPSRGQARHSLYNLSRKKTKQTIEIPGLIFSGKVIPPMNLK
jgi:hypothetical protein